MPHNDPVVPRWHTLNSDRTFRMTQPRPQRSTLVPMAGRGQARPGRAAAQRQPSQPDHPRRAPPARGRAPAPSGRAGRRPELVAGLPGDRGQGALDPPGARPPSSPGPGDRWSLATGTASGKSLAYLLPALTCALAGDGTTLYLAPTKALAGDQLRAIGELGLADVRAATYDGDTPFEERDWARRARRPRADQPGHGSSRAAARARALVVVLQAAAVRRDRRVPRLPRRVRLARRAGAAAAAPGRGALRRRPGVHPRLGDRRRSGHDRPGAARRCRSRRSSTTPRRAARSTSCSGSRRCRELHGEHGAPVRRTATAEAASLLADLVASGVRTLAFVRSRRGAESVALGARRALLRVGPRAAPTGSRPTAPATCRRTGGRSSARCTAATSSAWPAPTRSSSAST